MKILVIDDDEDIRGFLAFILKEMGHQIILAEDGLKGIEIVKENSDLLDLVITDRHMPGMLGEEVVRFVKLHYPQIKVILMTALLDEAVALVAKAAGADTVVLKNHFIKEIMKGGDNDVLRG